MVGDLVAGVLGKVIDRVWPDPAQRAQAALELERMRQAGEFKAIDAELQAMQMQSDINREEAKSGDPFAARWRPFIGWVCGFALAWHYIGRPLCEWALIMAGKDVEIPAVDLGDLIVILLSMLGLGTLRTAEKIRKVSK